MSAQSHEFRAEARQLLDLVIHSLYSDREVFLRELVSNAADALDKVRFLGHTRPDLVAPAGDTPGIRITADPSLHTVTIEDDGIGLSEEEAVRNLGTIAHSGTKRFLEEAKTAGADTLPKLIGQFGVGFYSAFMVADRVVVESRSAEPDVAAVRWESDGRGSYTIEPGDRAARGTKITLHLREDAHDLAEEPTLERVVKKHSSFVAWPIRVGEELVGAGRALWAEPASQVTDEDANTFYRSMSFDWEDPALKLHVQVDSPLQVSALLFVPANKPFDLFHPDAEHGVRLYAKRVLITENAKDVLPKWLRFVRGVVDSEDIELNVSREMVQKTASVRKIKDLLVKRILKALGDLAGAEDGAEKYAAIWKNFGSLLKEGHYHASDKEREQLIPLLRFNAVSHADKEGLVSLAAYKAAMPEGQDTIWYLTASSREAALASPHLEAFRKKAWDVLLLTDPVDEWLVSELTTFDGTPMKSVARGELTLDDAAEAEKQSVDAIGPWMKDLLGDAVTSVRASTRLTESPCVLVDDDSGIGSNLERILRDARQEAPTAKRVLELNPTHPLVRSLVTLHTLGKTADAEPIARLLHDGATLVDGSAKDPAAIGRRLTALLERAASQAAQV
jgi:molecular chaperone HtpG